MDVYRQLSARHGRTEFVGYDDLTNESTVLVLIDDGDVVQAAGEGQQVEVVLDRFPFYAESGGQVGDTGTLTTPDGAVLTVTDTRPGLEASISTPPGSPRVRPAPDATPCASTTGNTPCCVRSPSCSRSAPPTHPRLRASAWKPSLASKPNSGRYASAN